MKRKIKVLIVDDSALVRQTLTSLLEADPEIEVMGTATDPFVAAERMRHQVPDVITLDFDMPRMDGLTFLRKIMSQHPLPVVMCCELPASVSDVMLRALEFGAVDVIEKPETGTKQFLEDSRQRICEVVKAAANARLQHLPVRRRPLQPKLTADAVLPASSFQAVCPTTEKVIIVGASTGGTEALRIFLENLPEDAPGVVIVQHMPENFTGPFARRLDSLCRMKVKEAANGDTVMRGQALIAPGNRHTLIKRSGARYLVEVKTGPLVSRHRPSVDVLFRSAAQNAGKNAIGVIMTGMGDDGARGLLEMHEAGAWTIAQDEESCVVFGMPQEAIKLGGVDQILPLAKISSEVLKICCA